jgi:molybdopterin synthase catalytic subunit
MPEPFIEVRLLDEPAGPVPFEPFPTAAGGECVFLGRTRLETHPEHGPLVRLSYEAYRPMAERTLRDIAAKAVERFGCLAVRVHHALGPVEPGAASVLVQVACGHRAESFEACRFIIDALKAEAPIWKREEWADGTTWSEGSPAGASPTSTEAR